MVKIIEMAEPIEYLTAVKMMESKLEDLINGNGEETLFILEHKDIYTAGLSAKNNELLNSNDIPVEYTNRGGKFTYHGPGQVIIYPILNLSKPNRKRDVRKYIMDLELLIINTLKYYDIFAFTIPDKIGVWIKDNNEEDKKIASIGVR